MIPDFKTFISESIWSDMQDRSSGETVRKEDIDFETESRIKEKDFHFFAEDIVLYDYENSVKGFKEFVDCESEYKNHTYNYFKIIDKEYNKTYRDLDVEFVKKYWKLRHYNEYIDGLVKETEEELAKIGLKKTPGKTYDELLQDLWENMDKDIKDAIINDMYEQSEEEFYNFHNPHTDKFNRDSFDPDFEWERMEATDCIRLYKRYAKNRL